MGTLETLPDVDQANRDSIALKAFFGITKKWDLSDDEEQVLLGISQSTLDRWKNGKPIKMKLKPDTLERISYVLGIYKALRILLPNEESANKWIRKPNKAPLFCGKSALDKLLVGRVVDLADVRRYLDAERGW